MSTTPCRTTDWCTFRPAHHPPRIARGVSEPHPYPLHDPHQDRVRCGRLAVEAMGARPAALWHLPVDAARRDTHPTCVPRSVLAAAIVRPRLTPLFLVHSGPERAGDVGGAHSRRERDLWSPDLHVIFISIGKLSAFRNSSCCIGKFLSSGSKTASQTSEIPGCAMTFD